MLQAAVLRSPYARAEAEKIDLSAALAAPGVRGAIGPGDCRAALREVQLRRRRGRRRLRRHVRPGAGRGRADRRRVASARAAARRRRGGRARRAARRPPAQRAATSSTGSPRPTSWSRRPTAPRSCSTTRWRPTRRSAAGSATRSRSTSRRSTSGASAPQLAEGLGIDPDHVRVICEYMGGGFGSKNSADDYTFIAAELARRTGRPVRCALTRREEMVAAGNRNATIQRLDGRRARRRHAHRARRRVRERGRLVRLELADRGADAHALRLPERAHRDERRAAQPAADEGVPRARLHRGDVRARVPARRARREARRRPARAAPPQPRRHRAGRRERVLEQEPARVLPPRRAALGAPPRGARPLDRHRQARSRAGLADLVGRRRPAELRLDPRRLERPRGRDHRRPGRRHRRRRRRSPRSRPRSSGSRSRT